MNSNQPILNDGMFLKIIITALSLMCAPITAWGQSYYPADNDADYYSRQYHTPVTPVNPQYEQAPNYPSDNDADYYEYYYGTTNTDNAYPANPAPYYNQGYYPPQTPYYPPPQQAPYQQQYRGAQDYYQGYGYGNGYPQDNDDTYYADPSGSPTVNQWDE